MEKLDGLIRIMEDAAEFQPVIKSLYDVGLVYYDLGKRLVWPVSEQARLALHSLYAQVAPSTLPPLSRAASSSERCFLFQRYVLASMLSDKALDMLMFRANSPEVKQCVRMDAVTSRIRPQSDEDLLALLTSHPTMRVIWSSKVETCRFCGVLMPPISDPSAPIVIFDSSVTSPYESNRVKQMNELSTTFAAVLRKRFPERPVQVVAFWSEDFESAKHRKSTLKKITSVDVFVADRALLRTKMPRIKFDLTSLKKHDK
jgi:hypothetical protein